QQHNDRDPTPNDVPHHPAATRTLGLRCHPAHSCVPPRGARYTPPPVGAAITVETIVVASSSLQTRANHFLQVDPCRRRKSTLPQPSTPVIAPRPPLPERPAGRTRTPSTA